MRVQVRDEDIQAFRFVEVDDGRFYEIRESITGMANQIGINASKAALEFGRVKTAVGDATEALNFLISQLAYTEQKVYEKLYQPMQYTELVPRDFSAGEYVDTIRYETSDMVGQAQDVSGKGDDIPEVDVAYADVSFAVPLAAIGYSYTQEELRRTAFLKRPLSSERLKAAMLAYERKLNDVGLFGNSAKNLTGLYNAAGVTAANRPSGQAWSASNTAGTPDKIIADLNAGITNVWTATQFTTTVDTIVVAPTAFAELLKPRATFSDKSILEWFKENNLAKNQKKVDLNIQPGYGLDTAGAGSGTRALFYAQNPDNLVMHIPMPLRFLAPQLRGLKVFVPGEFKYSGVQVRRTPTMYYMDGV